MKRKLLGLMLVFSIITNLMVFMPMTTYAASGTCGSNLTWTLSDDGTLTISGTGEMTNWKDINYVAWYKYRDSIKRVIIENGVTSIGAWSFDSYHNITDVTIPNSVTSIGQYAFYDCIGITKITVPKSVSNIGTAAFHTLGIKTAGPLGGGYDYEFGWTDSIPANAFSGCYDLVQVVLPDSITNIGDDAFYHCNNLSKIKTSCNLVSIGETAFYYCISLTSITLPSCIRDIKKGAFVACSQLTNIYYSGSTFDWNAINIGDFNDDLLNAHIHYNHGVPVSSVLMTSYSARLKVGETKQLCASVLPKNASNKTLSWSSNNTKVASVDSNGVVTAKSTGTAIITAKSHNGKSVSCGVTVQDSNIIDYDDFGYSFSNNHDSFGYSSTFGYIIPLERYLQAGFSKETANSLVQNWGGNCFGMSTSSILFYKNILKEENYNSTVNAPSRFDAPDSDFDTNEIKLRNMIELFQVSYHLPEFKYKTFSADDITKELDNGNPVSLFINGTNVSDDGNEVDVGHEVVIYGYRHSINDIYTFQIYDCSNFVYELVYRNNKDFNFSYTNETNNKYNWDRLIGYYTFDTMTTIYNKIKNNNYNNATSLFSYREKPAYTYIIRPIDNITITNSSGKSTTIINSELSGEIDDIRVIPSSYLAENPTYTIIAPTDTYTIVGSGDEVVTTSFADDYMSASVTAKSSTPITISSDLKGIGVDTVADEAYSIKYTTYDNIFDEMTLSGTAAGAVSSTLNDADITLTGVDTLIASASVSDSVVSTNSDSLSNSDEITVKCEETNSGATIQILSTDTELTAKTSLPERLQADSPTYDLESGTYEEGQVLTFTKDDDTIIYYTTDGSIPSADNGIIYSLPIDINKSMTVKAISTKYGYLDSEVVELNYTLPEVDMPQANLESGEYDKVITVELSTGNYDDTIYYTLDGSNPLENGILYTVPINISEDTNLQAYTIRNGCISEICEYDYVVTPAYPFYFSNSLVNQDGEIITPDNIADLTKVKLTLSKLHTGEQSGLFVVSLYDADNRLIYMKSKTATISEDIGEVEIDITDDVSSAYTMKAFAWKDFSSIQPICEAFEDGIVFE